MPAVSEKVMDMVRRELEKNPDVSNDELFQKAVKIDPSVAELSSRQFNARYPLQVKRGSTTRKTTVTKQVAKKSTGQPRGRPRKSQAPSSVRSILMDLVMDAVAADTKTELVTVIMNLDTYEERLTSAIANSPGE